MKHSLQTKLLRMCIFLVLLTTIGISVTYYILTKQDKHRESQQRIQIAFDIMLNDFKTRLSAYTERFEEFLKEKNNSLVGTTSLYNQNTSLIGSSTFLSSLQRAAKELKKFGGILAVDRLSLYGGDLRLLAVYQRKDDQESVGGYLVASETGNETYLPLDNSALITPIMLGSKPIPETPLPEGFDAFYAGEVPERIMVNFFNDGQQLGIRSIAPLLKGGVLVGILVGETLYPEEIIERLASLSKTEINLFAGHQLSVGTLPAQATIEPEDMERSVSCERFLDFTGGVEVSRLEFEGQGYYQGQCAVKNAQGATAGAITISLSQEIEEREVSKLLTTVLIVSLTVSVIAFALTAIASRKSVHFIQQLIQYIDRIAKGDIPDKIREEHKGEFGDIKQNLNKMIDTMNALLQETDALLLAVQEGRLDIRGNAGAFTGDWKKLVLGMNRVVDAFVDPINMTAESIDRIAKGDVPERISGEYQGDFNTIKENLNMLIDATDETTRLAEEIASGNLTVDVQERSENDRFMKALNRMVRMLNRILGETNTLIESVQDGRLEVRGQIENFDGVWRELVAGINAVIEAFFTPIDMAAGYIEQISRGDVPDEIPEEYKGDFNLITHNLNTLIGTMNEVTRLAEKMSEGDLTIQIAERSDEDSLLRALNAMSTRLNETVLGVKSAAEYVATGSHEISQIAEQLARGSSHQAAAAEEVSSSMEEMAANIRQNADNAQATEQIALKSVEDAREGGQAVQKTIEAMKEIESRISIVQEIALQTNILSMNATIEAAKAQDYGKGFAVVASEVRALARRSQEAAEKIEELVRSCVLVSEQAGEILQRLVPNSEKTAELVQEITSASHEQNMGADQINGAIQQLDSVIQHNSSTSEQMASSAEELANQAKQLQGAVEFFTVREILQEAPADTSPGTLDMLRTLLTSVIVGKNAELQTLLQQALASAPKAPAAEEDRPSGEEAEEQTDESKKGQEIVLEEAPKQYPEDERDAEFERF